MRAHPLGELLDLLLPAGCLTCGAWSGGRRPPGLLCERCRTKLPVPPWPRCPRCDHPLGTGRATEPDCTRCRGWSASLRRARAPYILHPPASDVVHALKYGGWPELAKEMGVPMATAARPLLGGGSAPVVVPVPTTRKRIRERGYNQAALLARAVAERLGLGVAEALRRDRSGPTQVALPPSRRRANVRGVFAARDGLPSPVRGLRVLLVDDVLTTAATAGSAADELVRLGATEVLLVVYARALTLDRSPGSEA